MAKVILDITMSIDGFIAGEDISKENPMGNNGILLHKWIFEDKTEVDSQLVNELTKSAGAVIVGGRTYNIAIEDAWGGSSPFEAPAFVLCSKRPDFIVDGFSFIHNGIGEALEKAKQVAGDKNVWIMGGANTAQQFMEADLIDEYRIHIAPILLGKGVPLFSFNSPKLKLLEKVRGIDSKSVTHLFFQRHAGA